MANIFDSSPSNHPRGAGTANASNHPRGLANIINSSPSNHLHGVVIANANNHPCGAASVVDPSPNNHVNEVVTGATSNSTPSTIPWPRVQFRFEPNAPEAEQELSVVKTIAAATMKMFKLQGKPGTVIEERVLSHVADVAAVTVENIDEMSREAHARYVSFDYSLDTIRDMKAAGKLPGISEDMWLEGDERLRKSHGNLDATLKHYIDKRLASARRDGSREELLEKLFQEGYPSAETLVKLLYEGQHPIMKEDFIPNGHLLESLLGVMIWCSQCFLMARCFMCQLFRAKDKASKSPNYTTELSDLARSDLNFWRAIALVTSICPFFFGAPLKRMRENQQPDIYMRVDASGRGAGVFYSATPFDDAGYSTKELEDFEETSLRWTDEEVEMMERFAKGFGDDVYDLPDEPIADENKGKVPINTLEFFGIIFFVIFFAHLLKGKVVHCGTDSQSALSWCLKARVKGNWAADTLAKIFTLFCLAYGITITYSHVQGKMNHYADFRSRSESLDKVARNRDKALIVDTNTLGQRSRKWKMCRKLLMDVLTLGNQRKSLATLSALTTVASLCGIQEERR